MTQTDRRPLASRREVAAYLQIPESTLEQWAYKSMGPPYRRIGRHCRYRWAEVDRWLDAQRCGSTGGDAA